jgi:hypothetical protein
VGECPRDEQGCKTTGVPLYWPSSCIGVSLNEDSSQFIPYKYFEQAAVASFGAWTEVECETGFASIGFARLDDVACHEAEYNKSGTNANIILFQDTRWGYTGVENNVAKTTVTFDDETGEILDADIEMNHANNHFTISDMVIEYDLQSILTHEIGHMMGLDHTPDPYATMYFGYEPGTIEQRTLEPDDVFAVCAAYPPERDAACAPDPRGGLGDQCGGVAPPSGDDDGGDSDDGCTVSSNGSSHSNMAGSMALAAAWALTLLRKRRCRAR